MPYICSFKMHNTGQWLIVAIFKLIKMSLQKECLTKMAMNELNTGYKIINYVNIILHSCNMSFFLWPYCPEMLP